MVALSLPDASQASVLHSHNNQSRKCTIVNYNRVALYAALIKACNKDFAAQQLNNNASHRS